MELSRREYEPMLELAVHALRQDVARSPWPLVTDALARHFGAAAVTMTVAAPGGSRGGPVAWTSEVLDEAGVRELSRRSVAAGHPLIGHYCRTGDTVPRTADELTGWAAWRRSPARSVARQHVGAEHVLGIPCGGEPGVVRGVVVYGATRFSAPLRAFARRVQPLLAAVDAHDEAVRGYRAPGAAAAAEAAADRGLTPRELSVLALLGEALPAKAIAGRLGISVRTVNKHLQSVYRKLESADRMSAVLTARSLGLLADGVPRTPAHGTPPDGSAPAPGQRPNGTVARRP